MKGIKGGVLWTTIDFGCRAVFQLILQVVLARNLMPEDFGIVGMAVVFTSILQAVLDLGMGAALIQRKADDLTEVHFNTAFWAGILWSFTLYVTIFFIIAPLVSKFYSEPILVDVIRLISLGLLFNSWNLIHQVKLTRALDFKKLMIIGSGSNFLALVFVIFYAFNGGGVWSMAIFTPLVSLIAIPLYISYSKWRPQMIFGKDEFKHIFSFGLFSSGTQIVNRIGSQVDYLLVGKLLSPTSVGIYSFAFQITDILRSKIVLIVSKVMYPIYGKNQDNIALIRYYFGELVKLNFYVVSFFMLLLIWHSEFLIHNIFGGKWDASVPIVKLLAIAAMIHVLVGSHTSLIRGLGKPKLEFNIQVFKIAVIFIPLFAIGITFGGVNGLALAVVVCKVVELVIAMHYLKKLIGFDYTRLFTSIIKPVVVLLLAVVFDILASMFFKHEIISILSYVASASVFSFFILKEEIGMLLFRKKPATKNAIIP